MFFPLYDTNPHRRTPWVTLALIAANTIVMFWLCRQPPLKQWEVLATRGFIPARIEQLSDPKAEVKVPRPKPERGPEKPPLILKADPGAIYASLFTMMFLHGNWFHLIANMWPLWIFGNNVEDRLGHVIYLCFYLLGGLLAAGFHYLTDMESPLPVVGASGAVAAVLGAYAVTWPTAKVRTLVFVFLILLLDMPAWVYLGLWLFMQLLAGAGVLPMGNVAVWAHVGGFAAGLILMPILAMGAPPSEKDWRDEADTQFGPDVEE